MQARQLIDFMRIIGQLKHNTRHVWSAEGRKESVAEHSWLLSVMALLISDEFPDVDMNKVIKMCLIHDFGEAITGDIPAFLKTKQDEDNEDMAIAELLKLLPKSAASEFSDLFSDMAARTTPEARLLKALDNLEGLISHNEASLETWLPLEYEENLTYGSENVAYSGYLTMLREEIKQDSIQKIKNQQNCDKND